MDFWTQREMQLDSRFEIVFVVNSSTQEEKQFSTTPPKNYEPVSQITSHPQKRRSLQILF